jgi:hypothetical protein
MLSLVSFGNKVKKIKIELVSKMAIEMHLVRTRFETLDESGNIGLVSYGVRLYDDFECTYVNTVASLDELLAMDSDELVEFAHSSSPAAGAMLSCARDVGGVRLFVDGEVYGDE